MTPYYQDEWATIYLGDCLEVLPTLEAESVDLVLTDPPYGTLDGRGKVQKVGNEYCDFNVGDWDCQLPLQWVKQGAKLLEAGGWCVAFTDKLSVRVVWDEFEESGLRGKQTFYWVKTNPPPQPRKNFCSAIETAVCGTKGPVRKWNGGGATFNWFQCPLVTSHRTGHTTEKPLALMQHLLVCMSNTGDLVLDPFAGSFTTCRAAKDLNRKSIGIEIDERWCEVGAKRLEQEVLDFRSV